MKLSDFKLFLSDRHYNSVFNLDKLNEPHNMDLPATKYFMFSSHNTYLTKDQLFGMNYF